MIPKNDLDAGSVRKLFDYNPATGDLIWKEYRSPNARPGMIAGYVDTQFGYRVIRIGRLYLAHRLAWLHYYGEWPLQFIDHINGDGFDNRIANLRDVTRQENALNSGTRKTNHSGFRGVSLYKPNGKWRARINLNGKEKSLGYFKTKELAVKAYEVAAKEVYGEFQRKA